MGSYYTYYLLYFTLLKKNNGFIEIKFLYHTAYLLSIQFIFLVYSYTCTVYMYIYLYSLYHSFIYFTFYIDIFFGPNLKHAGSQFPKQESNLRLLQWKHRTLTIGLPGNSLPQSVLEHQHKRYPPPLKVTIHLPPPPQPPAFSPGQTLVCFPCIYLFWTFHINGFIPIWSSVTGFFHLA